MDWVSASASASDSASAASVTIGGGRLPRFPLREDVLDVVDDDECARRTVGTLSRVDHRDGENTDGGLAPVHAPEPDVNAAAAGFLALAAAARALAAWVASSW